MTDIPGRLRAARERVGLTIEDIAARTKISATALRSIERGEYDRLPGDFYTRAFLKAYAREVRLAPEEILREFDASRGVEEARPAIVAARPAPVPADESVHVAVPERAAEKPPARGLRLVWPARQAGAVVAVAVLLLIVTAVKSRSVHDGRHEAGAVGTSGVAESATLPADATPKPEAAPDKLILEIQPSAPIWVTGDADGKRVLFRLVESDERVMVEARKDLTFRIGNAAAFRYSLNGVPGKPLGGPDEVREFQITPENYRTFRR